MSEFSAAFGCTTERNAKTKEQGITFHSRVAILQHSTVMNMLTLILAIVVTLEGVFEPVERTVEIQHNTDDHHFQLIYLIVSSFHKMRQHHTAKVHTL